MSLKIALCDDSAADCRYMHGLVSLWAQENMISVSVREFTSAESFLFTWEEDKTFDILLLDIEMGKTDGVTLARNLRRDGGQIVQHGTHAKLLSDEGGKYAELWNAQAQYYTEK